jgi:hypothetical protein
LLCSLCNGAIGSRCENTNNLLNMITYANRPPTNIVYHPNKRALILGQLPISDCEICGIHLTTKQIRVDHIHNETQLVRGILCQHCNSSLGFFHEDPIIIQSAISYLTYWNQQAAIQSNCCPVR